MAYDDCSDRGALAVTSETEPLKKDVALAAVVIAACIPALGPI